MGGGDSAHDAPSADTGASRALSTRQDEMEQPKQTDGASLIARVYALALERIDDLMGCTEDSPEERELSLWAEIADRIEQIAWGWDDADQPRQAKTTGLDTLPPAVSGSRWSAAGDMVNG